MEFKLQCKFNAWDFLRIINYSLFFYQINGYKEIASLSPWATSAKVPADKMSTVKATNLTISIKRALGSLFPLSMHI